MSLVLPTQPSAQNPPSSPRPAARRSLDRGPIVIRRPGETSRAERHARTVDIFAVIGDAASDQERRDLLAEVVALNLGVADSIAGRFRGRGVEDDDLRQVAYLALHRAATKFDPANGSDFLAYAVPTMTGEIRKHFRDHGWMVRPPRRIQELQARVNGARADLVQENGSPPRPSEIAERLGVPLDDVVEALACDGCFTPASLDVPVGSVEVTTLGDLLTGDGEDQAGQNAAEARAMLGPVVRRLGERDRVVIELRFFRGWTQAQIGEELGVTQMQVSRILSRLLARMRDQLTDGVLDVPTMPPTAVSS